MQSNKFLKVGWSLAFSLLFSSIAYADDQSNIHTWEVAHISDTPVISTRAAIGPHDLYASGGIGGGYGRVSGGSFSGRYNFGGSFNRVDRPSYTHIREQPRDYLNTIKNGLNIRDYLDKHDGTTHEKYDGGSSGYGDDDCRRRCIP